MEHRPALTLAPRRELGTLDAAFLITGSIFGVGIFLVGGVVAEHVRTPLGFLSVWVIGGILALAGGLSNAELGAAFPRGGGEYVYLREAYGPSVAFLSGWTAFLIGFPGSIAVLAVGLGRTLGTLIGVEDRAFELAVALGTVFALTATNALGLRASKWTQNVLSITEIAAFVAFAVAGLVVAAPAREAMPSLFETEGESISGLGLALVPVLFAFCGWNAANYVAGEIRRPERALARAIVVGTSLCLAVYLALGVVYLRALSIDEMRGAPDVARAVVERLFSPGIGVALTATVALAILTSLQATVVVGPRLFQAMAEDGVFFAAVGRVHPRTRVPVVALVVQAAAACVLVVSGTFEHLLMFTTFAIVLFSILTVAGVMVLRLRRPTLARPFRTPLYPLTPALFVLANGWVLWNVLAEGASEALAGCAIIGAGVPVYMWFRRRRRTGR
jgi:basic amino acid/polyamine antiporter, APA family